MTEGQFNQLPLDEKAGHLASALQKLAMNKATGRPYSLTNPETFAHKQYFNRILTGPQVDQAVEAVQENLREEGYRVTITPTSQVTFHGTTAVTVREEIQHPANLFDGLDAAGLPRNTGTI